MGQEGHDARPPESGPDPDARLGRWMFAILFWGALIVGGSVAVQAWLDQRTAPRALAGDGPRGIELVADRRGHYIVTGLVNGREVEFLVDTGASSVAIPKALADELDLPRGRRVRVQTANGTATALATSLDSLAIGPLRRRDVPAHITPGMSGRTALLGMSFLRHHDLLQRDGRLVIREPADR